MKTKPFTVTAHTGCMGTKPNSIEAILTGFEAGADIIEFDLNFDSDGTPLLSHDAPKGGEVTLDEAFATLEQCNNLKANVDVKSVEKIEQVVPLAKKHGVLDRIFFTGVHEGFAEAVKTRAPEVEYYLNVDVLPKWKQTDKYLKSLVDKVKANGAIGINFNKNNATKRLVNAFHKNGLLVSIWTVDEKRKMKKIISLSPDNITTRHPDTLIKITEK
ncbi:MAG: glycerophosphodiester phosphodiesterase [Clostridia bacterium]|nr:glycerophosphodiester phosphodiesterase [Clostridia bacterium]